jgi:hypothetical protein
MAHEIAQSSQETLPITIQAENLPAVESLGDLEPVAHFNGAMLTSVKRDGIASSHKA